MLLGLKILDRASILQGYCPMTDVMKSIKYLPKLVCLQAAPYTMLKETSEQMTGNNRYEGFCVDLIKAISEILGFNYTINIAEDGKHGNYDKKLKRWNGMIGTLLDQVSDRHDESLVVTVMWKSK